MHWLNVNAAVVLAAITLIFEFDTSVGAGVLFSPPPTLEQQAETIGLLASAYSDARSKCCNTSTTQNKTGHYAAVAITPPLQSLGASGAEVDDYLDLDNIEDETDTITCTSSGDCKIALHQEGLFCLTFPGENGTCRPQIPQGGACRDDGFCQQGLVCSQPGKICVEQSRLSQVGGFCTEDSSCEGAANVCDLNIMRCINDGDQALHKAAVRNSSSPMPICDAVERAECYERCNAYTKKEVLLCSYCCLDCESKISCAKAKGSTAKSSARSASKDIGASVPKSVTGPLLRP